MEGGDEKQKEGKKKDWRDGGFMRLVEADPSKIEGWKAMRSPEFWVEERRRKSSSKAPEVQGSSGQNGDAKSDEAQDKMNVHMHRRDASLPGNDVVGLVTSNLIIRDGQEGELSEPGGSNVLDAGPSSPLVVVTPQEKDSVSAFSTHPQRTKLDSPPPINNGLQENSSTIMVASLTAELNELKKKFSKFSTPESPPPLPTTSAIGPRSPNGALQSGNDDVMEVDMDLPSTSIPNRSSEDEASPNETSLKQPCLLCYKQVPSSTQINKHLDAIFILDKLLCLPATYLAKYMETCQDSRPNSWISLCGECGEVVDEARKISEELLDASKRYKGVQGQVITKIKLSMAGLQETTVCGSKAEARDMREVVIQETRKFVSEHDYGRFLESFPEADLEAARRLIEEKRRTEENLSGESNAGQHVDNGVVSAEGDDDTDFGEASQYNDPQPHSSNNGPTNISKEHDLEKQVGERTPDGNLMVDKPRKSRRRLIEGAFIGEDGKSHYRCPFEGCSKEYRDRTSYLSHKLGHSGEKPKFPCGQCEKVFTTRAGLFRHKKIFHERQIPKYAERAKMQQKIKIPCPHCDHVASKHNLTKHIKVVHQRIYTFNCEICGQGKSARRDMRWHQAKAHGICSVENCGFVLAKDRKGLRNHQLQVHEREIDVLACKVCGKLFVGERNLRVHQKRHADDDDNGER